MSRMFKNVSLKAMTDRRIGPAAPILVMGVTACGKSEIARRVSEMFGVPFIEGDALHPASNIAKMSRSEPLDDADRWPWLAALADDVERRAVETGGAVFSCSALKRVYRRHLRDRLPDLITIFLDLDLETAHKRASHRAGHFMPATLVESQFAILERPRAEQNTVCVDARLPIETVVDRAVLAITSNAR